MDISTTLNMYRNDEIIIEDVVLTPSFDGTSCNVSICGPYGIEFCNEDIADCEVDSLKNELSDVNIIVEPCA